MVEKKIANRLCCAPGVSQHLGHGRVVVGLTGPCRAQPGPGLPCHLLELWGDSGSAHPVPPSLLWLTAWWRDVQCRHRKLCWPQPLMEWDETQEFKQWMAQWATDSVFSCCSKLLPAAAAYTVCSALQGMLILMNVFLVQVVPVSDRAEGDTASLTKFRLILCPHFPFTPSTLLSPKPRSSCFYKWFFFFNMVFCCVKHPLISGWSLNITAGVYNQMGRGELQECEPALPLSL